MKKQLALIFFIALTIRFVYIAVVPPRPMSLDDSFQWNNMALHFLHGKGFLAETADLDPKRPPIYPLFVAANYFLFGEQNFISVKISQAVLSSLTCLGVFAIGWLVFGPATALWAGIVAAVYPPLIVYSEILQTETIFTFLLVCFVLAWILAVSKARWSLYVLTGILLGLCNLCRGSMLFFPFFVLGLAFFINRIKTHLSKYIVLMLVSFAVIAPWTWRNYKVYNTFMPIVYGAAESFWFATLPLSSQRQFGDSEEFKSLNIPSTVKDAENFFRKLAVNNILKDPIEYAVLTVKKFVFFWYQPVGYETIANKSFLLGTITLFLHLLLVLLFMNGIILTYLKKGELFALHLIIAYFMILHTLLPPMPRYRLPIEPLMLLFAAAGIVEFIYRKGRLNQ